MTRDNEQHAGEAPWVREGLMATARCFLLDACASAGASGLVLLAASLTLPACESYRPGTTNDQGETHPCSGRR